MLYSYRQATWKLGDFGLAAEGTSKRVQTSRYARGTASYRAPELVKDGKFNNKVDIWAMGCILFEVVFRKKAFDNDTAVYDYSLQNRFFGEMIDIPYDAGIFPGETFHHSIQNLIHGMLEVEFQKRPSANELLRAFEILSTGLLGSIDVTYNSNQ